MKLSQKFLKDVWFKSIRDNNVSKVKFLIDFGIDIDIKSSKTSYSGYREYPAIMYATVYRRIEIIEILLKAGANVNMQDDYLSTSIITASNMSDIEMIKILLKYNADIKIKNCENKDALSYAKDRNHQEIIELLESYSK